MSSFYVDNCLASVQTQSELDRFIDVATEIMAERKFDLRGREHSNPSDPIASPTNILGMIWDRHWDTLSLNIPDLRELMEVVITKRNIPAASCKVFDPLGITGPVLLLPKLWLQSLWKSQIGIRKLIPVKAWRHVSGSLNPADCPSRGCSAKQLCSSKWWEGPSWLHLSPQEWHISDVEIDANEVEVNKERRAIVTSMMNVQTTDIKSDYFSIYSRNNRVVAWILRFIHNVSNATKLKRSLGYEEFKRAEVLVFKFLQSNAFQDERLLAKMQAFKDEDGLLRIRTKLADS
ncbi:integrase_H2C2 domain-containing protein [Trichonephila clavipes]|nr:integrase_H2C2 domain-containing protein [Trichonephila clavipes]